MSADFRGNNGKAIKGILKRDHPLSPATLDSPKIISDVAVVELDAGNIAVVVLKRPKMLEKYG